MLKTSPVLAASPSTSPASFRHATSRSHVHSLANTTSSPAPAAGSGTGPSPITRRSSSQSRSANSSRSASLPSSASASMKSPQVARNPARNVNPTEAVASGDRGAGDVASPRQNPQYTSMKPPPSPSTQTTAKAPGPTTSSTTSQATESNDDAQASATMSPNKRRGSPQPSEQTTSATITETTASISPKSTKRAKSESPPKKLPIKYEFCAVEDIVELISCMLAELITTNDAIRLSSAVLTRFHSRTPPGISVRDYLHRLARHATLTPPLLLAMVYYIDRLCAMYQEFTINTLTVHRFLITAATVAAKGLSDSFWNNATYARVGGVRIQELKLLELEFLHRVDWKIVPNPEVLVAYYNGLVERTPGYILETGASSDDGLADDDSDDVEVSVKG